MSFLSSGTCTTWPTTLRIICRAFHQSERADPALAFHSSLIPFTMKQFTLAAFSAERRVAAVALWGTHLEGTHVRRLRDDLKSFGSVRNLFRILERTVRTSSPLLLPRLRRELVFGGSANLLGKSQQLRDPPGRGCRLHAYDRVRSPAPETQRASPSRRAHNLAELNPTNSKCAVVDAARPAYTFRPNGCLPFMRRLYEGPNQLHWGQKSPR